MGLCGAFLFFTIGMSRRRFPSGEDRERIFRRWKEGRAVVTKLAVAASDQLEKE